MEQASVDQQNSVVSQHDIRVLNQALDNVKHIPSQHRQYKRFISLSSKVALLSESVRNKAP